MLERLIDAKASFNVITWENQRRKQESEMDRYTKFPHMFKCDEILKKNAIEREQKYKDYEKDTNSQRQRLNLRNSYNSSFYKGFSRGRISHSIDFNSNFDKGTFNQTQNLNTNSQISQESIVHNMEQHSLEMANT